MALTNAQILALVALKDILEVYDALTKNCLADGHEICVNCSSVDCTTQNTLESVIGLGTWVPFHVMTCIEPLQFPVAGDTVLLAVPHVQGRQVGPTVAVSQALNLNLNKTTCEYGRINETNGAGGRPTITLKHEVTRLTRNSN